MTTRAIKKVATLIEKHGIKRFNIALQRVADELKYCEQTDTIIKQVCIAFQVNNLRAVCKKPGFRKTTEESEAYTYIIFFVNKYKGHNSLNETFKELEVSISGRTMYHKNIRAYGIDVLDEKIPRHKQILSRVKIAETFIEQQLLYNTKTAEMKNKKVLKIESEKPSDFNPYADNVEEELYPVVKVKVSKIPVFTSVKKTDKK